MAEQDIVTDDPTTLNVLIQQGQRVRILLEDSDGYFDVEYGHDGQKAVRVYSDESLPDDKERSGELYHHFYGESADELTREVATLQD